MEYQPFLFMLSDLHEERELIREDALSRGNPPPVFNPDTIWDFYHQAVAEPVPDDMQDLLDRLDEPPS